MSDTTTTTTSTTVAATIGEALAALPPGGALVIPLAGLPAGTQLAITIIIGPPAPPAAESPAAPPARRYLGGRQ